MIDLAEILQVNAPSVREAVTLYFQEAITSGKLCPGDVLPSSREIAARLGTSSPNVHQGLVPLVKAGLLKRDRKNGTVVTRPARKLSCVALYVYRENLDDLPQFQRVLIDRLTAQLAARNISTRLVLDNTLLFGFEQVCSWARNHEVQGVLSPLGGKIAADILKKFEKLPLAVGNCSCGLDMECFIRMAVAAIHDAGCRRPAVLTIAERFHRTPDGNWRENDFFRILRREMKKYRLEYHENLIRGIHDESEYFHGDAQMNTFGFHQCNELLSLPESERPDALLVFPDQLITGTMLSVIKNAIPVPDKLKLFVHRNWEIEEPLFLPATMIGISVDDVAAAIIENLFAVFRHQSVGVDMIAPTIRINQF